MVAHQILDLGIVVRLHAGQYFDATADLEINSWSAVLLSTNPERTK